jgi:ectoine hydroxylase-related dioxygenase (phytanoyl-CoA dioxygenase family)
MNEVFHRNTPHRKYFLSSYMANIVGPGAAAQILHIDTPVPEPLPRFIIKANIIWLLDDFTEMNGATEIIPKSHLLSYKPQRQPTPDDLKALVKVVAPSGSILVTHGALWHRSGENRSEINRTVLLSSFASSFAREISSEDDTVRFLPKSVVTKMDPRLFDMIGGNHGVKPGNHYFRT